MKMDIIYVSPWLKDRKKNENMVYFPGRWISVTKFVPNFNLFTTI